jgi:hypothetical protein
MATYKQSGGTTRHWSFDPSQVDSIPEIMKHLVVEDEYFQEEDPMTILANVLDQILAELPPEFGEPVRLVYLTGLSYRAAGKTLGIDHKTVKKRADLGLETLRGRLMDTAWVASLLDGQLPERPEAPRLEANENVLTVLSRLNRTMKEDTDDTIEN